MNGLRIKRPDAKNALSIVAAAERQLNFTLTLPLTDESAFNIIRNVYECFRMLGDALLVSQGIVSQDHVEQIRALEKVHVKTTRPVGIVDNLRKLRHNINYYGYNPSKAEAMDAISFAQACFWPIIGAIKKELKFSPYPAATGADKNLSLL